MMRKANPETDFKFTVDGVGEFVYGRRTLGDSIKIRARFLELASGHADDADMAVTATAVATHEVLCVSAPEGWADLLNIDSVDPANVARVYDLLGKVGEQENSFRGQTKGNGAKAGAGTSPKPSVLVSA